MAFQPTGVEVLQDADAGLLQFACPVDNCGVSGDVSATSPEMGSLVVAMINHVAGHEQDGDDE